MTSVLVILPTPVYLCVPSLKLTTKEELVKSGWSEKQAGSFLTHLRQDVLIVDLIKSPQGLLGKFSNLSALKAGFYFFSVFLQREWLKWRY